MTTNMFMVNEVVLPSENDDNLKIYGEYTLPDVDIFKDGDLIAFETDGECFHVNGIVMNMQIADQPKDGIEIYNSKEARENIKTGTLLFVTSPKPDVADTVIINTDDNGNMYINRWGMADAYALRINDYTSSKTLGEFRKYDTIRKSYLSGFNAAMHIFSKEIEKLKKLTKHD